MITDCSQRKIIIVLITIIITESWCVFKLWVLIPGTLLTISHTSSFESVPSITVKKRLLCIPPENIKMLISLKRVAVSKSQRLFSSDS